MWYANSHPGQQYVLEEIVAQVYGGFPVWHTPVCATCQLDNARHQYVLDEIATYDQPGMVGLGDFGFMAALSGRRGRTAKRLRPVVSKGRVFAAPARQPQVPGYGSGGSDAMQYVAEAEIGAQAASQSRWQRPITQAPMGLDRLLATGATIGAGMGKEAADARNAAQKTAKQNKFLQSQAGASWAKTSAGQQWGASKPGQTWQEQQKFNQGTAQAAQQTKFLQSQAGAAWAQTPAGQQWGASEQGLVWQDKYYPKTEQQKQAEAAKWQVDGVNIAPEVAVLPWQQALQPQQNDAGVVSGSKPFNWGGTKKSVGPASNSQWKQSEHPLWTQAAWEKSQAQQGLTEAQREAL